MATTTITTTAAEDARIVDAFGKYLGLGRNATAAEVKAQIAQFVRGIVQQQEMRTAQETATASVTLINPT